MQYYLWTEMYVVLPEVLTEHYLFGNPEFFWLRKCLTLWRVRGLTIPGTGNPPAECGFQNDGHKRRHHWDSSIYLFDCVKEHCWFLYPVDCSGRHEDSCGSTVQGRPRRRKRRGGSPKRPRKANSLERKSIGNFNRAIQKIRRKTAHTKMYSFEKRIIKPSNTKTAFTFLRTIAMRPWFNW